VGVCPPEGGLHGKVQAIVPEPPLR
jgi:hypothetical protein